MRVCESAESAFLQTRLLNLNPVCLDFVVEGLAADAEAFGGFELVAAGFLEHLDDGVALDAYDQYGTGSTPQQWFNGFLTESGGLNAMATFGTVGTANTTCGGTTCGPTVATGATKLWGSMEWGIWNGVSPPGIDDPYFIFGMATWLAGSGGANISQYYNSGPATLTKGTTPNAAAEYLRDFVQ